MDRGNSKANYTSYSYQKQNKLPNTKKEFFEKAFKINKQDFDEPLISKDEEIEEDKKTPMDQVLNKRKFYLLNKIK